MANGGQARRTRKQWQRLVRAWRTSGRTAGDFATAKGVLEGTLRWWAWRLQRDGELDAGRSVVTMVPVRVVDADTGPAEGGQEPAAAARVWTLRTHRGELTVHGSDEAGLRVAIELLLDEGSGS